MLKFSLVSLIGLTLTVPATARVAICTTDLYTVTYKDTPVLVVPAQTPPNQLALSGTLAYSFSATSTTTKFNGTTQTATYNISATLCAPSNFDNGTVHIATHGLGFGKDYWDFPYELDTYSFAEAAAKRGQATFFYDRLGVGNSTRPVDGINLVQSPVHVEIAHQLVYLLRNGVKNYSFERVVGLGHSYGSMVLVALTQQYPTDLDDLVLTGFSASTASMQMATVAFSLTLASVQNSTRFGNFSNTYLATGGPVADQTVFFAYPYFDPAAFETAEKIKETLSLGELLTLGQMSFVPNTFTGGVMVISGALDFIFCGGNCTQIYPGTNVTFLEAVHSLYPMSTNFTTEIVPQTAHALNVHKSAPSSYGTILDFVANRG